jgi:succinate dehydrogenase / fumarate reductase, cytochrome b subunit
VIKILDNAIDLLSYRGGQGQWAYVAHRLSGVGILVFLVAHVVDTALLGWGPETYNHVIGLYRHPFFRVNEVFLFAAVLYHAINGVRVIVLDMVPGATRRHKGLLALEAVLFLGLMIPAAWLMLKPVFFGGHP